MPIYDYCCDVCQHADIEYMKMNDDGPQPCPVCQSRVSYKRQISLPHTPQQFHKPIEMDSVACSTIEEVREIQRKCPDVQIDDRPDSEMFGIPVARTRQQKLAVLRAVGYSERN